MNNTPAGRQLSEIQSAESLFSSVAGLAQVSLAVFGAIQITQAKVPNLIRVLIACATVAFLVAGLTLQARLRRTYKALCLTALLRPSLFVLVGLGLLFLTFVGFLFPDLVSRALQWAATPSPK